MPVLRKDIKQILEKTGFSVEIYEADSTPSFEPATYMHDIQLTDFVIFVFDATYGTPRPTTGRSGVHEEWDIVKSRRIPYHVYLKRLAGAKPEAKQDKFIADELIQREISYFYYTDVKDLKVQVRKSIARMTLDIGHSPEFRARLSARALVGEISRRDYDSYYRWDRAIRISIDIEDQQGCLTTAWSHVSDSFTPFNPVRFGPFIDRGTQEVFAKFLSAIEDLCQWETNQVVGYSGELATFPFPDEPELLQRLSVKPPLPPDFYETRKKLRENAISLWGDLGRYIETRYSKYADR